MDAVLTAAEQGATIVAASASAGRQVLARYDRARAAAGHSCWRRPDVVAWQAWLRELWWCSVESGGEGSRHVVLTGPQQAAVWRRVLRDSGSATLPGADAPLVDLVLGAWKLCQDWGIGDADLLDAADSDASLGFARWVARYRAECLDNGWIDEPMARSLLAAEIRRGALRLPADLRFVGFVDWTPAQRHLVAALAAAGSNASEEQLCSPARLRARRVECPDDESEILLAARWARRFLERNSAAEVAIVVPGLGERAGAVRRAVLDVVRPGWRLEDDGAWPSGIGLERSMQAMGVVRAAILLLRGLTGGLEFTEASELLRSPYLPAAGPEASARARLELGCREWPGRRVGLARLAQAAQPAAPVFFGRIRALLDVGGRMPDLQEPGGWAALFREALTASGWPGERPLRHDERMAAAAWQQELEALRACDRVLGPMTFREALESLEASARRPPVIPTEQTRALHVLEPVEAAGLYFEASWVCGLTAEQWPPAARPDPLLPLSIQRRLRLPGSSPPLAREHAERVLRRLCSGAGEVVLSWPGYRGEERFSPSPLLDHAEPCATRDLDIHPQARHADQLLAARATEPLDPDPPPPVEPHELPMSGGAGLLERQSRCPARAFLEFRLGARELRDPPIGIDAALRGTLTHAALDQLARRIADSDSLRSLTIDERDSTVREVLDEVFRARLPAADTVLAACARAERERLCNLLLAFLESETERGSWRVLFSEREPAPGTGPESIRRLGLRLRIDRVDIAGDGRRLVIDYKTGQAIPSAAELCGPRPRSPQLPLYATLCDAHGVAFVHLRSGGIDWLGVGHGNWSTAGIAAPADFTRKQHEGWGTLRAAWWTAIDRLAREFLDGDFRVDRYALDAAGGQWAMATRVAELPEPRGTPP